MLDILTPDRPTLVLDAGSRFLASILALPGRPLTDCPRVLLPADDVDAPLRLRAFLADGGHPAPEATLVCGMGTHHHDGASVEARRSRMAHWREMLRISEGKPEACLAVEGLESLPPALFPAVSGTLLAADSGIAAVLAALSLEKLRDRSWAEGVTVVYAGYSHIQAFMIYQERILGCYEQHADISREALLGDLQELKLNWLPDEKVRAEGGHGCICGDLPAEAEGFRPTWIFGPRREHLKGFGRLVSFDEEGFERCYGMLFGLARREGDKVGV